MDLHANQIQGFFDIPVDNLLGSPIFVDYFHEKYADCHDETMVVSPDVGSVARARAFAQKLDMPLAIVDKRRQKANSSEVMNIIGDVRGKHVILLDDMVDTGGSLCHAAKALVEIGGARDVIACASHGVLSGPAIERIEDSVLEEVIFLNTIPAKPGVQVRQDQVSSLWPTCLPRPSSRIYKETSVSPAVPVKANFLPWQEPSGPLCLLRSTGTSPRGGRGCGAAIAARHWHTGYCERDTPLRAFPIFLTEDPRAMHAWNQREKTPVWPGCGLSGQPGGQI